MAPQRQPFMDPTKVNVGAMTEKDILVEIWRCAHSIRGTVQLWLFLTIIGALAGALLLASASS